MEIVFGIRWAELLPDTPLLEILLRGTVMYLGLFLLLRFVNKRPSSSMSTADILVIVLLADAAQNAMADDYTSLSDGLLLVLVIILWSRALEWAGYRSVRFARILHPTPVDLIVDGVPIPVNLKRELITDEELMTALREQGVRRIEDVWIARVEGNGKITVIGNESRPKPDDPAI